MVLVLERPLYMRRVKKGRRSRCDYSSSCLLKMMLAWQPSC